MAVHQHSRLLNPARRKFLRQSAAVGATLTLSLPAAAAPISSMSGEVHVNGKRAGRNTMIKAGDKILTGLNSSVTFVVGKDAFMLRQMTSMMLEADRDSILITGLRILSGGLVAAFGPGMKMISTSLVAAAIRGTGIYIETSPVLTYFCTCYGEVGLTSAADGARKTVASRNHESNYVYAKVMSGSSIVQAPLINHTNAELAMLEQLAGRQPVLPVK